MGQTDSEGNDALSYGKGPLLALGVMAAGTVLLGGVGAVAMVTDEQPLTEVSSEASQDSGDEQDSSPDSSQEAGETSSSQDSTSPGSGSDEASEASSDHEGDLAHSGDDEQESSTHGPETDDQEDASAESPSGRHVADAPIDAPGSSTTTPGQQPRHLADTGPSADELAYGAAYRIRWGDTLSEIAVASGTSTEHLAQINGIADPDLIYAGDQLMIPAY
ncbi:LysM peptidoglycan-binding domain-containing protein [Kocuria palustris]|uniref:LysM peptidoglycan-binding domain-containing protein n=1 Tax=Kocuria palustris TaxID=71999 RepID=UPI0021A31B3F|nr:LysM peptidoglycan-binding domain-containing protein [Kocuria palustris]MCT1833252.1 LysM peptidoglycan-binding domain-containing protein [Kocuria palustris]MDH5150820.1 LysM peptidoglycan-binding domain-containing protein [Kocuria palustris]